MGGTEKLVGQNLEDALCMLRDVCRILDDSRIPYSLDAGTLLGIIRENRLLPWDTDMDLAISSQYARALRKVRWKIYFSGYLTRYRKNDTALGPIPQNSYRLLRVYSRKFLFFKKQQLMDIFVKYKHGENYYWIIGRAKPLLQSCPANHLDILIKHTFQGQTYNIPMDYDAYLTHHYGDWRVVRKDWYFRDHDGCNLDASKWEGDQHQSFGQIQSEPQ